MSEPIVSISQGKLKGKTGIDIRGNLYYSFKGIPYAQPPLGRLRFKAPEKHEGWSGVLDATKDGSECYQKHMITKQLIGSEDCLNLNVYTPKLPDDGDNKLRPVMVWIHGGAFESGSNRPELYGPEFLLPEDVVLVAINYRLGVLGFLSFEDPAVGVPGNTGFKDMLLALEWVKNNIKSFNGNPNNVTIFGESAGAVSTHLLMLSPLSKGLFHKVISQSGCAINIWVDGQKFAADFAKSCGFEGDDRQEMLVFLQNMPVEEIFSKYQNQSKVFFQANKTSVVGAVVETPGCEKPFLPKSPLELLKSGEYNKVPLLMGFTTKEGYVFDMLAKDEGILNLLLTDFETSVPHVLGIETGTDLSKQIGEEIKRFYFKKDELSKEEDMDIFYDLVSDNCFVRDILRSAKFHVSTSSQPVYLYRMSIESELNILKKLCQIKKGGVAHGDDLGYLFKSALTPKLEEGNVEDIAQKRFAKLWTNFAKYGNPNPPKGDPLIPVKWDPVTEDSLKYLNIDTDLTMRENPEPEKMNFWKGIFSKSAICKL